MMLMKHERITLILNVITIYPSHDSCLNIISQSLLDNFVYCSVSSVCSAIIAASGVFLIWGYFMKNPNVSAKAFHRRTILQISALARVCSHKSPIVFKQ
jgi:hypothetical protein